MALLLEHLPSMHKALVEPHHCRKPGMAVHDCTLESGGGGQENQWFWVTLSYRENLGPGSNS